MNFQERKVLAMIYKQENDIGEVEIIALLRKGSEKALATLVRVHHASLLFFAMQYVKNYQVAEDIVAESFFAVWQRRNGFENLTAIRSFLYTSVRNGCINELKQTSRHAACHEDIGYLLDPLGNEGAEEIVIDQMIKAELLQKLWQDAESLPPVRRRIFKMFFKEGLTAFEIANALRISVDTVRVQKARALHKLRALFRQKYNKWIF